MSNTCDEHVVELGEFIEVGGGTLEASATCRECGATGVAYVKESDVEWDEPEEWEEPDEVPE